MKPDKRKCQIALASLLALALSANVWARGTEPEVAGLIVRMEPTATTGGVTAAMLPSLSISAERQLSTVRQLSGGATLLDSQEPMDEAAALEAAALLTARSDVRYAVPNYRRWPSLVPNDARFSDQWYLQSAASIAGAANLPDAWDISTGDDTIVAVLDTGILRHNDFQDLMPGGTFNRLLPGYDFVVDVSALNIDDNDPDPGRDPDPTDPGDASSAGECNPLSPAIDSSWHGTLVAGVIAATADNFIGIAGINHQARILPVRVLGKCGGTDADIIDGARWAIGMSVPSVPDNPTPAKILNLSLGGFGACSPAYQEAFDDASVRGVLVVVAAGNESSDLDEDGVNVTPAECPGAFTIGATTRLGGQTSYTNVGSAVALSAPGGETSTDTAGILTTGDGGTGVALNDHSYEAVIGTSFAAPVVSGIAALGLAVNNQLTPIQLRQTMIVSARSFPTGTTDGRQDCTTSNCGAGIVDATEFLTFVRDGNIPGFFADGEKIEQIAGDTSRRSGFLASDPWLLLLAAVAFALWRRRY